jgi:hypothetical protein
MSAHSSYIARFLLMTSAVGLALNSAAYAADARYEIREDPFAGIIPLTAEELMEARGGYSAGGFKFNIGVTVSPPVITPVTPLPKGGPLPEGGPLPKGGPLPEGGPLPKGGPLDPHGAHSEGGALDALDLSPGKTPAPPPPPIDESQPLPDTPAPQATGAGADIQTLAPTPLQPELQAPPVATNAPSPNTAGGDMTFKEPQSPPAEFDVPSQDIVPTEPGAPSLPGDAAQHANIIDPPVGNNGAQTNVGGHGFDIPGAGHGSPAATSEPTDYVPAVSVLYPVEPTEEGPGPNAFTDSVADPTLLASRQRSPAEDTPTPTPQSKAGGDTERTIFLQDGLSIKIDNSLDNVVVKMTTDYDVRFENYHQQIGNSIGIGAMQSAISTQVILGGFAN